MDETDAMTSPQKSTTPVRALPRTPPQWKKPDDVMKLHRLKLRKNALAARLNSDQPHSKPSANVSPQNKTKRKNPFKRVDVTSTSPVSKKTKNSAPQDKNDESLFQLLGLNATESVARDLSCLKFEPSEDTLKTDNKVTVNELPIDWSLRYKLRFISVRQFPWTETLKTCEEASGITGFVRCVESGGGGCLGLDTSPNANFHQCCLYWQHPNLTWVDLFPRTRARKSDYGKTPALSSYPEVKESLHRDWSESFRSLFQLLRARHCPYFYMVSNTVNCVFRAAGINGCTETNVMISPTTRGFRKLLTDDGVQFTMPLKRKTKRVSEEFGEEEEDENEKPNETSQWLASLGVAEEEIRKINKSEEMHYLKAEKKDDGNEESLLYIEGFEVQGLFNFLINCRSLIAMTGPLMGIPPTLLSPVAFCGGSLMSLKVRQSNVQINKENYHSVEIIGPILPHAIHNLCNILENSIDSFSVTFANLDTTKAFTTASLPMDFQKLEGSPSKVGKSGQAFSVESLNDCGLKPRILSRFCSEFVSSFDSLKFANDSYICS
ncbi:protein downstream neighbor of son homolog [Cimex lectularius]|uniref:Protein downstream neighbor of son homolog n=1 Tax=Cimex lectularius TaxID=79782 RepID=A0A8I6RT05_CIMLE|nr:protein downstream neighbor of son homolog [Cimex lectularius]